MKSLGLDILKALVMAAQSLCGLDLVNGRPELRRLVFELAQTRCQVGRSSSVGDLNAGCLHLPLVAFLPGFAAQGRPEQRH